MAAFGSRQQREWARQTFGRWGAGSSLYWERSTQIVPPDTQKQVEPRCGVDQVLGSTCPFASLITRALQIIDNLVQVLILTGIRRELAVDALLGNRANLSR